MIKATLISIVSLGALSIGAPDTALQPLAPKALELATGPVTLSATSDGLATKVTRDKGLAFVYTSQSGHSVRLSF